MGSVEKEKRSVCCEIIKTCPLFCTHCSANSNRQARQLITKKDLFAIVEESANNGVEVFYISGGEPLLHPDIFELITFIKNKNMLPVLYSSGCILGDDPSGIREIPSKTLVELEKAGLDSIVFSIYSLNKNIHDEITNTPNSLAKLFKTIENSLSSFKYTKIELSYIPLNNTWQEIKKILEFSEKNNIYKLNILKLIYQGRTKRSGVYSRNLSTQDQSKFIDKLKEYGPSQTIIEISKLYDCDHYEHLQISPYRAGINEYFITSKQEILPGRRYRN